MMEVILCILVVLLCIAIVFCGIAYGMAYKAAYENYMRILNNPPEPSPPPKMPND